MSSAILSLSIDDGVFLPKYQQLQQKITQLITEQRLCAGDKVPSTRELASVLGISRTSSSKAIDNLIAEGWLVSVPKSGVYVSDSLPQYNFNPVQQSSHLAIDSLNEKTAATTDLKPMRFDSGADVSVFPNKLWAKSMRDSWRAPPDELLQGKYPSGYPPLLQEIAIYMKQVRGFDCCPSQIIVTAGNRDALTILVQALVPKQAERKNDTANIAVENPCYSNISNLLKLLGRQISPLNVNEEGAQVSSCESASLAILTPCRQYPLGITMSPLRRQEWLAEIKRREAHNKLYIIEDDYDNEFVYQGRMSVPLMQQDNSDSVVFVGSFSKVMFRGLRLGFIVAPHSCVKKIRESQLKLGVSGALAVQPALASFMTSGHFATHLRKMRRHYRVKRDVMLEQIASLQAYFTWQIPAGGMHLTLWLKPEFTELEQGILRECERQNLQLVSLSSHYVTEPKGRGFVMGYSELTEQEIIEQIALLTDIVAAICSESIQY